MNQRYWPPYVAGVALGVLLWLSYALLGHGLGASGGLQRITAAFVAGVAPEHVDQSAQWAPLAGGDRNPFDHWLVWGVAGVFLGGLVSGWLGGRLGFVTTKGPAIGKRTRWIAALFGGIFVGYAARMARGCTSGQALSGGAVLAAGSWAFMMCVFIGGYLVAWPMRRLWIRGGDDAAS